MQGLTSEQVKKRLAQYGPNELQLEEAESVWLIFAKQFNSPFIYVLFAAALVSLGLDHQLNSLFIFVVLLLNASIGTFQEYSAQTAAMALNKMVPQGAVVIRDGITQTIDAVQLVPDDVVLLAAGDKVPADISLYDARDLLVDESILTGESLATVKTHSEISEGYEEQQETPDVPISEQFDRAFAGTIVTHGRGQGVVLATGANTQIGLIAQQASRKKQVKPPLLLRIERFTLRVSYTVLVLISLLFASTMLMGADLATAFLLGVALAVSAIPEGLPAAITISLAIGMRRMANVNVIVRKLVAVESLGSCTYIASDKTGTLTVNEMTIKKVMLSDGSYFDVGGVGLDVHGEITPAANSTVSIPHPGLENFVMAGMLANEASLTLKPQHTDDETSAWIASGDGVDLAFLVLAAKFGFDHQQASRTYPEQARLPYESANAYSASINRVDNGHVLFVKGSTEKILAMCEHNGGDGALSRDEVNRHMESLARQGFRVLALASKTLAQKPDLEFDFSTQLSGLRLLGLVAMIDPLRPEAKDAVAQCRNANIDVAMITGDHPHTALALAKQLDICTEEEIAVSGQQLAQVADNPEKFEQLVNSTHVFARVEPNQKLQIVQQLIKRGEFVAVTGDGVNDAPALRNAHVGIAMGKRGTDVARESADLIITDDNFASIVQGVKQGRIVYNNIRKVIFLLISTGAAEITLFLLSILFQYPLPLFPIQLLWLNLVTNGIQDVALAFEPEEGKELSRPPRAPSERIFNRVMLERIVISAVVMGFLAFGVFVWMLESGVDETTARNATLLLMVLFENVHVFNSRSETQSIFKQALFGNPLLLIGMLCAQGVHIGAMYTPGLRDVLEVQPVSLALWSQLLGIALLLVVADELRKFIRHRYVKT